MREKAIDVHDELANASIGKTHVSLGIILALLTMFDGYDTFNPAYVIHYVRDPWSLSLQQAGMLVSSGLIGFLRQPKSIVTAINEIWSMDFL